jgi:T4 bacteriophage base plate protein
MENDGTSRSTLPTMTLPTYELAIPSTGEPITVRPFIVKEEKLLLIAMESKDPSEIIRTVKQVISNCILDDGGHFNVDTAPFFDVDYLFLALRAKSVGETVEMTYRCKTLVGDSECGNKFKVPMNVSEYDMVLPDIPLDIALSDKLRIKLKYPSYAVMKVFTNSGNAIEKKIGLLTHCIDYIVDGTKRLSAKDFSKDEIKDFLESLSQGAFSKLDSFVEQLPYFQIVGHGTCDKCGTQHEVKVVDFTDFFT